MKSVFVSAGLLMVQSLGLVAQLPVQPTPAIAETSNGFNLDWHGYSDRVYFIQYSTNLTDWSFMPVIENGQDAALGYGFNTAENKLFLRLKYTDVTTTNPSSDDFDGDNISNWDEVRLGGTGTDPLNWDSDGDGKSDYFSDKDFNNLADGWELQYFGSIGAANPDGHSDDDGLTNREESLMGSDPTKDDTDVDGVNDNEDAVWWDIDVTWPRSREVQYVVVELEGLNLSAGIYDGDLLSYDRNLQLFQPGDFYNTPATDWGVLALSNAGHVLLQEDLRSPTEIEDDGFLFNTGFLVPSNIPDSMRNHVWSPDTGSWNKLDSDVLNGGQTILAVATDVSASGNVIGYAWVPLKDSQGQATLIEKTIVKWSDISVGKQAAPISPLSSLGIVNPSFTALQSATGASNEYPSLYITEDGSYFDLPSDFDFRTRSGDTFMYTPPSGSGTGETRFKKNNAGAGELIAHGGEQASIVTRAVRIKHSDNPANIDIAAITPNGFWARRHSSWRKIEPHPVNPITGGTGVSEDFTVLLNDGTTIMRNGKILPISTLVPSTDWSEFRMEHMNDRGVMAGRAKKGSSDKIVLLVPVEILQPKLDNNGAIVQEGGVDKLVPVDAIRPSRWLNAWDWNGQTYEFDFNGDFVASDPDRFYIRTPMSLKKFPTEWMNLAGLGSQSATKLNFQEVSYGGITYQQSKELILVLDEPDDLISLNPGIGVDDGEDDLTHRVMADGSPIDEEIDLQTSVSYGEANSIQWLHPKVRQPTHDLEVELVLLVAEADEFNYGHHQFYKNRAMAQVELAKAIYGRIGVEFKHTFQVQAIPQSMWDSIFSDNDMSYAEGDQFINLYGSVNPSKPMMFFVYSKLINDTLRGFAYGFPGPQRPEYGHGFITLEGTVTDNSQYVLAHEIGHILGHVPKAFVDSNFSALRPYPTGFHVDAVMKHNFMVEGGESRFAGDYTDSKRINLDQQKLFMSSEFILKK